jgi:hypothetical protein
MTLQRKVFLSKDTDIWCWETGEWLGVIPLDAFEGLQVVSREQAIDALLATEDMVRIDKGIPDEPDKEETR